MGLKQVIVVRTDLKMQKGKIAAQCAHASLAAFLKAQQADSYGCEAWLASGAEKVVVKVASQKELFKVYADVKNRLPCELISDAGKTQVKPGSYTALGIGPAEESEIDKFTGKLKLL